jgi:hypothetical protein
MTDDALKAAAAAAERWLTALDERAIAADSTAAALQARFDAPLPESGTPAAVVIEELVHLADPGLLASGSGRFYGWVIGGALESALAADWLVSTWDQNAVLYSTSTDRPNKRHPRSTLPFSEARRRPFLPVPSRAARAFRNRPSASFPASLPTFANAPRTGRLTFASHKPRPSCSVCTGVRPQHILP